MHPAKCFALPSGMNLRMQPCKPQNRSTVSNDTEAASPLEGAMNLSSSLVMASYLSGVSIRGANYILPSVVTKRTPDCLESSGGLKVGRSFSRHGDAQLAVDVYADAF